MRNMIRFRPAALVALALVAACSSAPPPPRAPKIVVPLPEPEKIDPGPTSMESDIGGMNQDAMDDAFTAMGEPLQRCLEDGLSRVNELGGHLQLSLRIARD